MNKELFSLGAFAIFLLPTAIFAEDSKKEITNIEKQTLMQRIEILEKELQTLKSLVKSESNISSDSSKELITKDSKGDKDFQSNFTGSYINLSLGNSNLTGTSDMSVECDPSCTAPPYDLDTGFTYFLENWKEIYGDINSVSDVASKNNFSLALGKNWDVGNYVTGLRGSLSYGKGRKLTKIFEDPNLFEIRTGGGVIEPQDPTKYEEINTITITPSDFKSELTFLVGRPLNKMMPYLYAGIEGRQFKSKLDHNWVNNADMSGQGNDGADQRFFRGHGSNSEENFNIAPIVGMGLSYALSPKVNIDWKAGFSFHKLENTINTFNTYTYINSAENDNGYEITQREVYENSSLTTKTDLTEFNTQIGINYFF